MVLELIEISTLEGSNTLKTKYRGRNEKVKEFHSVVQIVLDGLFDLKNEWFEANFANNS